MTEFKNKMKHRRAKRFLYVFEKKKSLNCASIFKNDNQFKELSCRCEDKNSNNRIFDLVATCGVHK